MTIRYKLGTFLQVEDLQQKARVPYLVAYAAKYPESTTRVAINYTDKLGIFSPVRVIQLSTDGKLVDHSDRYDTPTKHSNYPTTDKALLSYDDEKENDDMETAYYYNPIACVALGCHPAITDISTAEAVTEGFFQEVL